MRSDFFASSLWLPLLLLVCACPPSAPPPGPLAPRAGVASDVAEPKEVPQKEPALAHAVPPKIVLYTENFDVKPGHTVLEQLRVVLGGDERPGLEALLASTSAIATAMPDPTDQTSAIQLLKVGDAAAVKTWIEGVGLPAQDPIAGAEIYGANPAAVVAWAPEHQLLMFGPPATVKQALEAAAGGPSLKRELNDRLRVPETADTMVVVNLGEVSDGFEPLVAAIHEDGDESTFTAHSASKPLIASLTVAATDARAVAGYLPRETVMYVSVATPSRKVLDLVLGDRIDRITEGAPTLAKGLDALGGAFTLFAAASPSLELTMDKRDLSGLLIGVVAELKSDHGLDPAWLSAVKTELQSGNGETPWFVSLHGDRLLLATGDAQLARSAREAQSGGAALAAEDKHTQAMTNLPAEAEGWLWADTAWVMASLGKLIHKNQMQALSAIPSAPGALALRAELGEARWRYELEGRNVMALAALGGMASALAIYGVQRYLASSKAMEARSNTSAIAHAAARRFNEEGRLCGTSSLVPAEVPAGRSHPSTEADWDGNDKTGWKCLRFALTTPHRYRYRYLGPGAPSALSGKPLGAGAIEVVAEGDLDADGQTSLFVVSGHVENKKLVIDGEMLIQRELE